MSASRLHYEKPILMDFQDTEMFQAQGDCSSGNSIVGYCRANGQKPSTTCIANGLKANSGCSANGSNAGGHACWSTGSNVHG
jgi:hypothetical protein